MKQSLKIKLIIVISIIVFLFVNKQVGLFNIPLFSVPNNCVRIKFKNESKHTIKSIKINRDKIHFLKTGDSYIYTYNHSGEGTYKFEVEFENGKKLFEDERYVEEGYYLTESIKNNSVVTQY